MKTSVNMVRRMGNFNVTQRTKDGYFNATELLKQWNNYSGSNKKFEGFTKTSNYKEFINALEIRLKEKGEYLLPFIRGKGRGNKSWMHPYLFMKFAMWLNPEFEVRVIEFVYDNLIAFRHDAGDNYIGLTNAVQRFNNCNYAQLAKGLNWIVFNKHEKGLRQIATEQKLNELVELQKKLAFAVDMGYIRTFDELLNEMRRIWELKYLDNGIKA